MQKIIPIYATSIGGHPTNSIVGINTNRIHGDIVPDGGGTKLRYYLDPTKKPSTIITSPEPPTSIYREMDGSFDNMRVILPLVGGGTISIPTADIIYCYQDHRTYERSSIDAIVNGRRNLYKLSISFMILLTTVNSPYQAYWDDLRVPAQNTKLNPTKSEPAFESWIDGLYAHHYDSGNADDESMHFGAQIPHNYMVGTDLHPHVHWAPNNTDTGSVVWELEYSGAALWTVFPSSTTIQEVIPARGVTNLHMVSELPVMDGSDYGISTMLGCRLTRLGTDGDDDYTGDAVFLEFDFHYRIDSWGSREEYIK